MDSATPVEATVIPRNEHSVSRKYISENALKVIHRLNAAGHQAFLVGGGVRDILLGGKPKDFDIATDAHPEAVHKLFRNSRVIGRRFKLVHVLFGRDVIEVATFRGRGEESPANKQSAEGMLLRDNVYGTVEDDAVRRDFTTNALYYSPADFCIYDYVGALKDIEAKTLRLIGDPETRYREDPVRMLRAVRFKAKLGFEIEHKTEQAIFDFNYLMENASAARLFDEVIKLLASGNGVDTFNELRHYGLFEKMFPSIEHTLSTSERGDFYVNFVRTALENTDRRIRDEKPITPAFLYAALLWPDVDRTWQQNLAQGTPEFPALQQAAQTAIQSQLPYVTIPKRFLLMIKEIWEFQIRLKKTNGRWPKQLIEHPRFRAAYDFLVLRERAGEDLGGLGDWWTQFQVKNPVPTKKTQARRFNPRQRRRRAPSNG